MSSQKKYQPTPVQAGSVISEATDRQKARSIVLDIFLDSTNSLMLKMAADIEAEKDPEMVHCLVLVMNEVEKLRTQIAALGDAS